MSSNQTRLANTSPSGFADGWVDQPNGRETIDIIRSYLFKIFVATYTVLHLNLPAKDESPVRVFLRKTKWMTTAVVVPEVINASAFAQYVSARNSVVAMKSIGCSEWTKRHAFFLNMGGVWLNLETANPSLSMPPNFITWLNGNT